MNKELEALDNIVWHLKHKGGFALTWADVEVIEECIQRNEPMKVISFDSSSYYGELGYFKCPKCGETITAGYYNYCPVCGQKLDWGDHK